MNRLPRITIDSPPGYKQTDFLSIIKKKMPKQSLSVENGYIALRIYKLGSFKKFDKIFSAWGMRTGKDISIFVEEVKPV